MRQIKFRGKCVDTGEWVYGYIIEYLTGRCFIYEPVISFVSKNDVYEYEIAPNTVGQFTGLYDKNGAEIYEGDIVSGLEYADFGYGKDGFVNSVVVWDEGRCSFMLEAMSELRCYLYSAKNIKEIGNIHDNPELQ